MIEADVMVALDVVQDDSCPRLQAWALAILAAAGVETRPGLTEMMIVWKDRSGTLRGRYRVSVTRSATRTRTLTDSRSGTGSGMGGSRWSYSACGNHAHSYALSFYRRKQRMGIEW